MEKKMMGLSWVFGLVVLVTTANISVHAITCEEAITALLPCEAFLTGDAPAPIAPCCMAVANINAAATTTQSRRDLCKCFQKFGPGFGVKPDKAKQLPQLCRVAVPVPIDPSVDCNKIP